MKKMIVVFTLMLSSMMMFAQKSSNGRKFKAFRGDLAIGYAIPGGSGSKGGLLFAAEPKYSLLPNVAVGARIEGALMINGTNLEAGSEDFKVQTTSSFIATGDFYFINDDFRPFIGGGAGIYSTGGAQVSNGNDPVSTGSATKFGGMIRGGFEYKHFRFGFEYNLIGNTDLETRNINTVIITKNEVKNSYIGIKFGFTFGGGRL